MLSCRRQLCDLESELFAASDFLLAPRWSMVAGSVGADVVSSG